MLLQVLVVPLYWVMMSIAAAKALWQLVGAPTFWEKTFHGLQAEQPTSVSPNTFASRP
jgi:hypothetical protein